MTRANLKVTFSNTNVTLVIDRETADVVMWALEHYAADTQHPRRRDVAEQVATSLRESLLPTKIPGYRHKEG